MSSGTLRVLVSFNVKRDKSGTFRSLMSSTRVYDSRAWVSQLQSTAVGVNEPSLFNSVEEWMSEEDLATDAIGFFVDQGFEVRLMRDFTCGRLVRSTGRSSPPARACGLMPRWPTGRDGSRLYLTAVAGRAIADLGADLREALARG